MLAILNWIERKKSGKKVLEQVLRYYLQRIKFSMNELIYEEKQNQ